VTVFSREVGDLSLLPLRYQEPLLLAGGGMAVVYRAVDRELGRPVAVKLLAERYAADPLLRERFRREALAAGRLSGSPFTVTIYDVGEWRGRPFLVMEYLAGGSLQQRLTGRPLPPEQALVWLGQAAVALDHADAQGVVHRDVKPGNLLLDEAGDVYVADFGIAAAAGLASLTETGTVLGTAGYLAPEQAEGMPASAAVDRYALAVVAFELLTGRRPFQSNSLTAEAAAHLSAPIPRASQRNPRLPQTLDAVFERALAKHPQGRFASCDQLVEALSAALDPADAATRIDTQATTQVQPRRTSPAGRSRARKPGLLAALLVLLAAGSAALELTREQSNGSRSRTHALATSHPESKKPQAPAARDSTPTAITNTARGAALLRQAQRVLRTGNEQAALPTLQQAVQLLHGAGSATEGTANYTLASTLSQLGSCDGVQPLLDRARALLGNQSQINQLQTSCNSPPRHEPTHEHHNGHGHDKHGNDNSNGND
jgi:serine/threonine-protein kinase